MIGFLCSRISEDLEEEDDENLWFIAPVLWNAGTGEIQFFA
jgi:hypothetical protein